jgi:hypothetical protein
MKRQYTIRVFDKEFNSEYTPRIVNVESRNEAIKRARWLIQDNWGKGFYVTVKLTTAEELAEQERQFDAIEQY